MVDQAEGLRQLVALNADTSSTQIITIASGKGGVGKSNVAANLSIALAQLGKRVVILDADLGLANINVIMGIIPQYNLSHVLNGEKKLIEIGVEVDEGITVIAGASGFSSLANIDHEKQSDFIAQLNDYATFDYAIIDAAAGIHNGVLDFMAASDISLIVTTPEPTAITDAYGMIKAVSTRTREITLGLLVNRIRTFTEGNNVSNRIISISSQFLQVPIKNYGYIFEDNAVVKSVFQQKPFIAAFPGSKASSCIKNIARKISVNDSEEKSGFNTFLTRFFTPQKTVVGGGVR